MPDIILNPHAHIERHGIGSRQHELMIIDDFIQNPKDLVAAAGDIDSFTPDPQNFYPGVQKPVDGSYVDCLQSFTARLFTPHTAQDISVVRSTYSIATQRPETLRPNQCIPHFDTTFDDQMGAVLYLCAPPHGGTSFYRHRSTGFERITPEYLPRYRRALEREATTHGLPLPGYINGDTPLFERIGQVDAKFNRLILYPSNLLHSGNVSVREAAPPDMRNARLTITSFIRP